MIPSPESLSSIPHSFTLHLIKIYFLNKNSRGEYLPTKSLFLERRVGEIIES
jgi:hypothetical protein